MEDFGNGQYPKGLGNEGARPGYTRSQTLHSGSALPIGTRLQEFEIDELIGEGGFSIVYRARDIHLGRVVALKEYLPATLARRDVGQNVVARSARHALTFQLGLNSFINEAQLLASFEHPSVVKVYRFWEQNGTAYMAMSLYEGQTLIDWLRAHNAPATEAWLRALLEPLLDALELMHESHCYHRDIAPDNVLLLDAQSATPRPVLLDFGAARRVIGNATEALTAILKPGFAPIEQYTETTHLRQGPWTDIYALCALLYHAVTGHTPMPSVGRLVHDELMPAQKVAAGRYSDAFLRAIDAGMAVQPKDRPQSIRELRALFDGESMTEHSAIDARTDRDADRSARASDAMLAPSSHASTSPRSISAEDTDRTIVQVRSFDVPPTMDATPARRDGPRALSIVVSVVVVIATAVATAAWYYMTRPSAPTIATTSSAPTPNATTTSTPPQPAPTPPDSAAPVETSKPAEPLPTPAKPSSTPAPFSVLAAMNDIVRGADPQLQVDVRVDKPVLRIGREALRMKVRSSQSGYVYIYTGGTDKSHFYLLFPNRIDRDNRIKAGADLALPRPSWNITAGGPTGVNQIVVLVSRSRRDVSAAGMASSRGEIPEFDLQQAAQRWSRREPGAVSPFIGSAECRVETAKSDCPQGYGATMVEVTEVAPS